MNRLVSAVCLAAGFALTAAPVAAKDSLGVFGSWAAFRDADTPRCYAIAAPRSSAKTQSFASIGIWPSAKVRGQVHFRLSRPAASDTRARLVIGNQRFELVTAGDNAWAPDSGQDAAIIAALRSTSRMSVSARAAGGGRFTDRYYLEGVATAIDASLVGCATIKP